MQYSLLLQMYNAIKILYIGGFSMCDLHLENLLVYHTSIKQFNFKNKEIAFNGLQLMVIDYDMIMYRYF